MDLSVIYSRALAGVEAPLVRVETHLSNGLPAFNIVGLPETAVRESKDRVRSAIINSHFDFPDRRITVNLAPADLPKEGGRFDLPIALGILSASGQVPKEQLERHEFLGELALNGAIRGAPGVVAAAASSHQAGRSLVVDPVSAATAALVPDSTVLGASDILTLCAHLNGAEQLCPAEPAALHTPAIYPDMGDVVGQQGARRALEIAASGAHSLIFCGPPGTGKTLLASRLPGILPDPDAKEALEGLALRDIQRQGDYTASRFHRPFRNPHHSASAAALVGGGSRPQPGEVSLAHGGVLFLDELPEFSRTCLEMLREPLECGAITLSRARHKVTYPARFQLVAAMNPCPCGYLGDPKKACRCSPDQVQRYRNKISGPFLDRIDMHVPVLRLPPGDLLKNGGGGEATEPIRHRVAQCRNRQLARQGCVNSQLAPEELLDVCQLGKEESAFLEKAAMALHLSGRSLHRTLRVARTIADLQLTDILTEAQISEALAYREH